MLLPILVFASLFGQLEFRTPLLAARYGRIIIEGNTDTPDCIILDQLRFYPGQQILLGDVPAARQRMRQCGVFRSNPWRGEWPRVELLPNEFDSNSFDVLVRVEERPGNWFVFGVFEIVDAAANLEVDRSLDEFKRLIRRAAEEAAREK